MEDERIVLLYWDRDEAAISESSMKYGAYCTSIAQNILQIRRMQKNASMTPGFMRGMPCRRTGRLCYRHFLER